MRLATVRLGAETRAGRVHGASITLLPYPDVGALLASGPDWLDQASEAGTTTPLVGADFAPVTPRPEKIVCVGINYRSHVEEVGLEVPGHPTLFAKYSRSLIGAYDDIVLPPSSTSVDWEAELGVVIGRPVRNSSVSQALTAVAGYTIINDVTMRDWQMRTSQFLQGKSFEASTPVGPFLVTPDEVDHARKLQLRCSVDDELMQEAYSSDLVFSVAELISYISTFITLVPGDLIATGTPGGVGFARRPPRFLEPGQTLSTSIEGLGQQVNRCTARR